MTDQDTQFDPVEFTTTRIQQHLSGMNHARLSAVLPSFGVDVEGGVVKVVFTYNRCTPLESDRDEFLWFLNLIKDLTAYELEVLGYRLCWTNEGLVVPPSSGYWMVPTLRTPRLNQEG